jgi:uncharacterized protein YndB with AHSA1/START domain
MKPDLSDRPLHCVVESTVPLSADRIYHAWTQAFDSWFAAEGSVIMAGEVGTPYFFETEMDDKRHPHYGRFLRLEPGELVEMTWMTGDPGTNGAETVVTLEMNADGDKTHLKLTHAGFYDEAARDGHEEAWPLVFEHMTRQLSAGS